MQLLLDFSISKADTTVSILRELFHLRETITYREYILILIVIAIAVHVVVPISDHDTRTTDVMMKMSTPCQPGDQVIPLYYIEL